MSLAMAVKYTLGFFLLCAFISPGWAQEYSEPTLETAHKPVRLSLFGECSEVLFFYIGEGDEKHVEIYSTSSNEDGRLLFIGAILQEGGPPSIESVFFRNVDADPAEELFVLSRWSINHSGLNTSGDYYRIYVYDQEFVSKGGGLRRLKGIEERIGEGFDGVRDGSEVVFPVKTVEDVDRVLGRESG